MTPEFSRLLSREEILRGPSEREIEASESERAALAERFGLLTLSALSAELRIAPGPGKGLVRVTGRLKAEAVQSCVVTLEPVPAELNEEFELFFSLLMESAKKEPEVLIDPEAADAPDPIGPEGIDLGEVAAEQLGLALDPYPRAPGADAALNEALSESDAGPPHPFAALAALKRSGPEN